MTTETLNLDDVIGAVYYEANRLEIEGANHDVLTHQVRVSDLFERLAERIISGEIFAEIQAQREKDQAEL